MRIEAKAILTSLAVLALVLATVLTANRLFYVNDIYQSESAYVEKLLKVVIANLDILYDDLLEEKQEAADRAKRSLGRRNNAVLEVLAAIRQAQPASAEARRTALDYLRSNREKFRDIAIYSKELEPLFISDPALDNASWSASEQASKPGFLENFFNEARTSSTAFTEGEWPFAPGNAKTRNLILAQLFRPWEWLVFSFVPAPDVQTAANILTENILDELAELNNSLHLSGHGYFMVTNGDGELLVHPKLPRGRGQDMDLISGKPLWRLFLEAAQAGRNSVEYIWLPEGEGKPEESKISFFQRFRPLGWYVIYTINKKKLEAPARRTAKTESAILAAILLVASLALFFFMRRHTLPLRRVTTALTELPSRGFRMDANALAELEQKYGQGADEPSMLLRTFGQMQEQLNLYVDELDAATRETDAYARDLSELNRLLDLRVQERTADLTRTNLQLQEEVSNRERVEQALRSSRRQLSLVVDGVPARICQLDRRERFLLVNRLYAKDFGLSKDNFIGKQLGAFFDDVDMARIRPMLQKALEGEESSGEITMHTTQVADRTTAFTHIPHRDDRGEVIGVITMSRDITEQKRLERALVRNRERAEAASQAKSMFLANMSHELRTPLNGVIGMLESVLLTGADTEWESKLSAALEAAEHLARLVDDVLDFSRVEADKMTLDSTPFDLRRLSSSIDNILRPQFKKKGLGLSWESDRDLVHYLVGDARRIMQVVVNLLSNALKHTTAGGVRVHISQESGGAQEDDLILALQVVDTGSGIPQDKLESIFESFTQLEETGQRSSGGAGLGLALCRRLARLMGGDVVAQSEPGRGSAFTFTAKLRRAPRDFEAEPAPAETVSTAASGYSVLAAEDNPLNAELLRHHLTALGHAPILVANGQEALDALAEKNFDLILMDMEMPVLDGLETTRRIRAGESGRNDPNIPIIAVTAHALPEYRKMCEQAGMSDYLPKPIRFNNLAEVLGRQLLPRT
jgi:PAS domain S-box-containing protein